MKNSDKKITIKIYGGLGNQMFQYAFARALSLKLNSDLILDASWFENITGETTRRSFLLDVFDIPATIISKKKIPIISPTVNLLSHSFRKLQNKKSAPTITEEKYTQNIEIKFPSIFSGYWQNEAYFVNYAKTIKHDFSFPDFDSLDNHEHCNAIRSRANTVSLHVRRGDYVTCVNTNTHHGTCSIDYYKTAINYITNKIHDPYCVIFSDDIEWCTKNFDFLNKNSYYFIDNNTEEKKSFRDMQLMSMCNHHIVANSSFSWWGAWLGQSPESITIAPNQWFAGGKQTSIVPSNWIKL